MIRPVAQLGFRADFFCHFYKTAILMRRLYPFFCLAPTLFFFLLIPASTRAQHYYFAPNTIYTPNLSEQHDADISIGRGKGENFKAFELKAAYSPVNHFAVVYNYFRAGSPDVKKMAATGAMSGLSEFGVCAYQALPHVIASITAGYGRGQVNNHYISDMDTKFKIDRWYVQPAIQYRDNYFEAGLSLRMSRLSYFQGDVDYAINTSELIAIRSIEASAPLLLPELGLSGALRLNPVSFKMVLSSIFSDTSSLHFSRFNLGFFLSADIGAARQLAAKSKAKKEQVKPG